MHRHTSAFAFLFPAILLAASTAASVGCGDSGQGLSNNDAGSNTSDASAIPDGGSDLDEDNDGFPASEDCDDNDDAIYPGTERDCQSDCDNGIQICLADGTWLDCTARTDCECTMPGEIRQVDCGNCGQATQECGLDLMWGSSGACSNEGVCTPGEADTETCQFCGTGVKTCGTDCQWGQADCFGTCTPGDQQMDAAPCPEIWEHSLQECNSGCSWDSLIPCTGNCFLQPRTGTTNYADEICIPGGPFIMGDGTADSQSDDEPQHSVSLSAYFIDKYEVTVGRYRDCVLAGVCFEMSPLSTGNTYHLPGSDTLPVNYITWIDATTFCAWDGGRAIPTEAQWEKAARGPAPRVVVNPWGNTAPTCALVSSDVCYPENYPQPVDAYPSGASYYGVEQLVGNVSEWVQDYYSSNYYSTSPAQDPTGPASGTERVMRGGNFNYSLTSLNDRVVRRIHSVPTLDSNPRGFRCARAGL